MKIGKKILLDTQYIRRIKHPEKYVSLKELCVFCGLDTKNLTPTVQARLNSIVWHICRNGMLIIPPRSVWMVEDKDEADFAMRHKALALISNQQYSEYPCIVVGNPMEVYAKMCLYYRSLQKRVSVTVVTGSIGKSTTSGMIASVYSAFCKTTYSLGYGNSPFEVGYSVQHIPSDAEKMVQEVCENIPGATQYLSYMSAPSLVVITSIDQSHFEVFGSEDAVAEEVCRVVDLLPTQVPVIVHKGEFKWMELLGDHPIITVSEEDDSADFYAKDITVNPEGLSFCVVDTRNNTSNKVHLTNIYAKHNISAALRAFAAGRCEGVPYDQIIEGLANYRTAGVRQNVVWTNNICIYADCYNAIATSVRSAVETACTINVSGRRIAVLGDIEECGEASDSQHDECMSIINQSRFDVLLVVGEKMNAALSRSQMREGLVILPCRDKAEVERYLRNNVVSGDLVLLKSSHSGNLITVIQHLWPSAYKEMNAYNKAYRRWKFSSALA